MGPLVDVMHQGEKKGGGLPAKTLETKAGRAASKPLYFGGFYFKIQRRFITPPKILPYGPLVPPNRQWPLTPTVNGH